MLSLLKFWHILQSTTNSMKIKNIKKFREFVWQTEDKSNPSIDFNFIGVSSPKTEKHGFFKMFHGINRGGVDNKIIGLLELAEDTQGVYEFIQNAADCSSKTFAVFYNEDYLLAFNDGTPFTSSNVISILNEGDSDKSVNDIGRFGVGFKIVHRLVGENDGLTELKQYKGPILFSWFDTNGINNFLDSENNYQLDDDLDSISPWLLKILLTNFPLSPSETVRDLDYKETNELFSVKEAEELKQFCLSINTTHNFNLRTFDKGSIFFLHLGKNKHAKVTNDITKLKTGVKYSLNFLSESGTNRQLSKIYFKKLDSNPLTNDDILEVANIQKEEFTIEPTDPLHEQILSHRSDKPIKIVFGYLINPENALIAKGDVSNFYKFFPLEKEVVGFNFLIHSDAFVIEKSRREMQKDDRNQLVFDYLIKEMGLRIQTYSIKETENCRKLFLSIYLSNKPQAVHSQFQKLYEQLLNITKDYIPVQDDKFTASSNVVAKDEKLNLIFKLEDWGISKQWFYWQGKENKNLLYKNVLQTYEIPKWEIADCILNAPDLNKINDWIEKIKPEQLQEFLSALEGIENPSDILIQKIKQLTLFKFSDKKFYSANETVSKIDGEDSQAKPETLVFHSSSSFLIKNELEKLQFITSEIDVEIICPNLFHALGLNLKQSNIFKEVRTKSLTVQLDSEEKKNVFRAFPELQSEEFFKNGFNKIEKLNNLLKPNKEYPVWLSIFSIVHSEYYPELDDFLIKNDTELFSFIYKNWASIITLEEVKQNVKAFYSKVESYHTLSTDKTLSLTKLPIVFVNETIGFKNSSEVYFHSTLKDCNYFGIQNAIKTIFELEIPNKDTLEFLSKEDGVFQITDDKNLLTRTLNSKTSIELIKDDVIEFVNFSISKIHENFFDQFIISEKTKDIYVIEHKAKDTFQVNISYKNVVKLIRDSEKLKSKYKLLPIDLQNIFGEADGVLNWKNGFYSSLLKDKELLPDPTEIYKYLFDTTSQKEYISEQAEILIPVNLDIDIAGAVYKILEWCLDEKVFAADEYKALRTKFKLQVVDEKFEVANSKGEIIIGTKTFSLSALLPKEPIDIKNEHTSNFLKQYSAKGLKEEKLKSFFGVEEDISSDNVFESMLTNKDDALNSRQVEFLSLFAMEQPEKDLSVFNVETLSGMQPLNQLFYTSSISFIDPRHILSDKYFDIEIQYSNNRVLSTYGLNEKNELDTSLFKEELNDEEKISLLEFIFGVWKTDIENFANCKLDGVYSKIGFDKFSKILNESYAVPDESLPEFYKKFLADDEEKKLFSSALGIYGDDSLEVKLRKYFENITPEKIFENIQSIDYKFLANTLRWLCTNEKVLCNKFHLESIAFIYGLKLPIEHNLYLYLSSIDSQSNLCFIVQETGSEDYYIDDLALKKLTDYEIPPNDVIQLILNAKKHLTIRNTYPEHFVFNENFKPIQIPESVNSVDELQNLTEWNEPYYLAWKRQTDLASDIFRFDGEIPRFIIFENETFKLKPFGLQFSENGKCYVSQNAIDVLEALRKVLAPDTYDSLIIFKTKFEVPPPPPPQDNSETEETTEEQFENPFKDITHDDETFIRGIIKGDFELNEKLDANTTAKIKTLMAIRGQYNASELSDEGRFLKAGSDEIIVRSAQNGLLYLDVYHWGRLSETNVSLSIYTKNKIEIFKTQEQLISHTKPQNKFGIVRMPNEYDVDDYNSLDNITDKGKWHYVFIVNENTKAAQNYKEVMNIDDYNFE